MVGKTRSFYSLNVAVERCEEENSGADETCIWDMIGYKGYMLT